MMGISFFLCRGILTGKVRPRTLQFIDCAELELSGSNIIFVLRYKFFFLEGGRGVTQKIWYLICAARGSCTNVMTKNGTLF